MSESDNYRTASRVRLHCRQGSEAERAATSRGYEICLSAQENPTHATLVFLAKYGRDEVQRGQVRTVLLQNDGPSWSLVMESISPPSTTSREQLRAYESSLDNEEGQAENARQIAHLQREGKRLIGQRDALQTALDEVLGKLSAIEDEIQERSEG